MTAKPDPVPDETRDLYRLIGNYERFTQEIDRKLESIEKRLEAGSANFKAIQTLCAQRGERLENLEEKIQTLQTNVLPRRTRIQINSTLIITILNALETVIRYITGGTP